MKEEWAMKLEGAVTINAQRETVWDFLMNIENMRKALDLARRQNYLPVHPGTIRYLKEKGMWSSEDDVWNEKCKALVKRWVKTYDDAIADADKKKISIKPSNETWMNLWKSHKKDLTSFGTGLM